MIIIIIIIITTTAIIIMKFYSKQLNAEAKKGQLLLSLS